MALTLTLPAREPRLFAGSTRESLENRQRAIRAFKASIPAAFYSRHCSCGHRVKYDNISHVKEPWNLQRRQWRWQDKWYWWSHVVRLIHSQAHRLHSGHVPPKLPYLIIKRQITQNKTIVIIQGICGYSQWMWDGIEPLREAAPAAMGDATPDMIPCQSMQHLIK